MMVQTRVTNKKIKHTVAAAAASLLYFTPSFSCVKKMPFGVDRIILTIILCDVLSHQQIKVGSRQHGADIRSYHLWNSREGTCARYRPQSTKREATELYSFTTEKLHRRHRLPVVGSSFSVYANEITLRSSSSKFVEKKSAAEDHISECITTFDLSCSLSHFPLPPLFYFYTSSQVRYKKIFFYV